MNPSYLSHRVTSKLRVWASFFNGVLIKDNHGLLSLRSFL